MHDEIIGIIIIVCLSILGSILKSLKLNDWKKFVSGILDALKEDIKRNILNLTNLNERMDKMQKEIDEIKRKELK